jgi:hypothetical protein|tara:strand:+ start:1297 stop:1479 length:183 start_codon:yes stop_codon:yes gene_type:complete
VAKIDLDNKEIKTFIGFAQKLIKALDASIKDKELRTLRRSEDQMDLSDVMAPQKCEDCND